MDTAEHRHFILVKHSLPAIIPGIPASQWRLGDTGRARCHALAEQLRPYQPDSIITSTEPKAVETGQIVAQSLTISCATSQHLHEHQRDNEAYHADPARFQEKVARFFAEPDTLVYGNETAREAEKRFSTAVGAILSTRRPGTPVIVAHGTVITLLVARNNPVDRFTFWKKLGLPSYVILDVSSLRLMKIVERVESNI